MKVLYLSGAQGADYMCDMLFNGLRSLLGPDCVDVNKLEFAYERSENKPFYTVYNNLPDISVDREDISGKLRSRYFDVVIYGSIHRFRDHLAGVHELYRPNRIVFIDGEDDWSTVDAGEGIYFKRELTDQHHSEIRPIEFCIPKEKIRAPGNHKQRMMSPLIPGDTSTYIYYDSEKHYYDQYSESYFGRTKKKGGWDCCRHYEIMAAGCMPYFENLEECPTKTLYWLPKQTLIEARSMYDYGNIAGWEQAMLLVQAKLQADLTTESMAKYVLDTVMRA